MGNIYKMIKMIPLAFLFLSLTVHAQNTIEKEISGIITYEGAPLSNVNILIKNSEKGTSTNNKGVYKIRAKEGDILQFTHINMKAIEVLIEDITTILNISMKAANNELDEVIISSKKKNKQTGLYPKKPKKISSGGFTIDTRRTGYSVRYISGEELNLSGISIGRALQGKIASYKLVVDEFGNEYAKLRDTGTLLTVKYAIWVVDGQVYNFAPPIPLENIKEVAVLRSLAGVNRFGSEAIGGAIIINTTVGNFDPVKDVYSEENPYTNKEYYNEDAVAYNLLSSAKSDYIIELESISNSNKAFKKYKELLSEHQDKSGFYLNVANSFKFKYNDFENYKRVLLDSEEYSKLNPEELKIIAYQYQQEGFYENALSVYKKIIKLRPKHIQSYRDLINVYIELKQYKKALNTYNYFFNKGFTIEENGIGEIMAREAEALTSKISKTNLPDEKTLDTRIVFEWSSSEAEFTLEFINPQKQVYKIEHTLSDNSSLILDEKLKGYTSREFVIDGDIGGEWLVNLTYYGNKKYAPTYLKTTVFNNWGRSNEIKKTTVYKMTLKDQKTQLFKINTY
ncbi:carboxypeptidase-like regulatory domain-containing protein [Flavobacteriaceae bacterium]|jgi:tetratricopeptide (TPR) repeat protein|nr:carboxypeptidase-like regulatory domain-containing protein [Flavobacteriaceae bacterium]